MTLKILNYSTDPKLSTVDIYGNINLVIPNVTTLRTTEPSYTGQIVTLLGHTTAGLGGGDFRYDASDTITSDDNRNVIVTTVGGKRWKRILVNNNIQGLEHLFNSNLRIAGCKAGYRELTINLIGQSFFANSVYITNTLASILHSEFGNGADGYVPFGFYGSTPDPSNNARNSFIVSRTGSWTDTYLTSNSPSLSHTTSSTVGNTITVTAPADSAPLSSIRVYAIGHSATATFRVRVNGGAWSSALTISSGTNISRRISHTISATGAYVLDFEVVSGTVNLSGVELLASSVTGVKINNLGASGARIDHWTSISASQFDANLKALEADLTIMCFGGNDAKKNSNISVAQFGINLGTLIDRVQASMLYDYNTTNIYSSAKPTSLLYAIVPQNYRIKYDPNNAEHVADYAGAGNEDYNTDNLSVYALEAEKICKNKGVAFVNLQEICPPLPTINYADYGHETFYNIYISDGIHPSGSGGGASIARLISNIILGYHKF